MNAEQRSKLWGEIIVRAWQDDAFKRRLMAEPATILKECGLEVPAGLQLRVVENTNQVVHLTLPAKPREEELSDQQLAGVAGGTLSPSQFAEWFDSWKKRSDVMTPEQKADLVVPP